MWVLGWRPLAACWLLLLLLAILHLGLVLHLLGPGPALLLAASCVATSTLGTGAFISCFLYHQIITRPYPQ